MFRFLAFPISPEDRGRFDVRNLTVFFLWYDQQRSDIQADKLTYTIFKSSKFTYRKRYFLVTKMQPPYMVSSLYSSVYLSSIKMDNLNKCSKLIFEYISASNGLHFFTSTTTGPLPTNHCIFEMLITRIITKNTTVKTLSLLTLLHYTNCTCT